MAIILSTKKLPFHLRKHLFNANIGLVEYDAIKIIPITNTFKTTYFKSAIFTSQNAVRLFVDNNLSVENAFCVGSKTAACLKEYSIDCIECKDNASELATSIAKYHCNRDFHFFCSQQRRDELPNMLIQKGISLTEHYLYKSEQNIKRFHNQFDAVLCFSPLGAKTYYDYNEPKPTAICIGETTARALKTYTNNILLSKLKTVESVIYKAIKSFKIN